MHFKANENETFPLFIPFKTIFFSFSNKFCTNNIKKKKKIENFEPG